MPGCATEERKAAFTQLLSPCKAASPFSLTSPNRPGPRCCFSCRAELPAQKTGGKTRHEKSRFSFDLLPLWAAKEKTHTRHKGMEATRGPCPRHLDREEREGRTRGAWACGWGVAGWRSPPQGKGAKRFEKRGKLDAFVDLLFVCFLLPLFLFLFVCGCVARPTRLFPQEEGEEEGCVWHTPVHPPISARAVQSGRAPAHATLSHLPLPLPPLFPSTPQPPRPRPPLTHPTHPRQRNHAAPREEGGLRGAGGHWPRLLWEGLPRPPHRGWQGRCLPTHPPHPPTHSPIPSLTLHARPPHLFLPHTPTSLTQVLVWKEINYAHMRPVEKQRIADEVRR